MSSLFYYLHYGTRSDIKQPAGEKKIPRFLGESSAQEALLQWRVVFSKVLVIVRIIDGIVRVGYRQALRACLPINKVIRTGNNVKVTHFMNEGSGLRICSGERCLPEDLAQVNGVRPVRINIGVVVLFTLANKGDGRRCPGSSKGIEMAFHCI